MSLRVLPRAAAAVLLVAGGMASAEPTAVGLWRTVDDATGKPKALIRIVEDNGILSGRIVHLLNPDPAWDGKCNRCRDHRRDQSVVGMVILSNMRKLENEYGGGEVLDPENGNIYRCTMRVTEGGNKLEVRGFIGIALFGRTQVWWREN